jgi:hypothetical protein
MKELPPAGEVTIFDRSWYNRALVEHVMGFCTDKQYSEFLRMCPGFEGLLKNNGIILIKYWSRLANKNSTDDSYAALRTLCGDGNSVQWIWNHIDAGMTTHVSGRNVRSYRYTTVSLECGSDGRQKASSLELHCPFAQCRAMEACAAGEGQTSQTTKAKRL